MLAFIAAGLHFGALRLVQFPSEIDLDDERNHGRNASLPFLYFPAPAR
jgi:hypothetical protein